MSMVACSALQNALQDIEDRLIRILKLLNKKLILLNYASNEEIYLHSSPTFTFSSVYQRQDEEQIYLQSSSRDDSVFIPEHEKTKEKTYKDDKFSIITQHTSNKYLSVSKMQNAVTETEISIPSDIEFQFTPIDTSRKFFLADAQDDASELTSGEKQKSKSTSKKHSDLFQVSKFSTLYEIENNSEEMIEKISTSVEPQLKDPIEISQLYTKVKDDDRKQKAKIRVKPYFHECKFSAIPKLDVQQDIEMQETEPPPVYLTTELMLIKDSDYKMQKSKIIKEPYNQETMQKSKQEAQSSGLTKTSELSTFQAVDCEYITAEDSCSIKDWLREHTEQMLRRKPSKRKRFKEKVKKSPDFKRKTDSFDDIYSDILFTPANQPPSSKQMKVSLDPDEENKLAFVTIATHPDSIIGALVLGQSLRLYTEKKLIIFTSIAVSPNVRDLLTKVYDEVIQVPILDGSDLRIRRPDLSSSLTKIECWKLTNYSKCVFLDCDTLVLQNCDELFNMEELSAAPDVGWPDCFNTGVFVYKPSNSTYEALISLAKDEGSFDGGEHGLLNSYFNEDWMANINKRLSFVYNANMGYIYTYAPAFKQFGSMTKIAHFKGHPKPWLAHCNFSDGKFIAQYLDSNTQHPFLQHWLDIFNEIVYKQLPEICQDIATTGNINTVWNLLLASKTPELYLKAKEDSSQMPTLHTPEIVFEAPPLPPIKEVFPLPYRQSFHEFRPSQYSDQVKVEFHSDSASPTRATDQARRQIASPTDIPLLESGPPVYQKSENSVYDFTRPTFKSSTEWLKSEEASLVAPVVAPVVPPAEPKIDYESRNVSDEKQKQISGKIKATSSIAISPQKSIITSNIATKPERMRDWEQGNVDYLGKDKFENIQKRLDLVIKEKKLAEDIAKGKRDEIRPKSPEISGQFSRSPKPQEPPTELPGYKIDDFSGMYDWEAGRIDFTGRHRSDNIMRRLDFFIAKPSNSSQRKK